MRMVLYAYTSVHLPPTMRQTIKCLCVSLYLSVDGDPRSVVLSWLKGTGLVIVPHLKPESTR